MRVCEKVFSFSCGPGLDSMSPATSRRSASHVAGTHGWLPQKTEWTGLRRGGNRWIQFAQSPRLWRTNHVQAVSVWCLQSSSCHQTFRFHCSVHLYPISLTLRRLLNVQECVTREHRNTCAVFSSSSPPRTCCVFIEVALFLPLLFTASVSSTDHGRSVLVAIPARLEDNVK